MDCWAMGRKGKGGGSEFETGVVPGAAGAGGFLAAAGTDVG